jgi:hypothetical protein
MTYRDYLLKSLNRVELLNATKSAEDGFRYCNALCQDFRPSTEFSNNIPNCRTCRNKINLAVKFIKEETITLEQFKHNPGIVDDDEIIVFDTKKKCYCCKEEKNVFHFETNKNICKTCRHEQSVKRNDKDINILFSDIEKAKNNLPVLENFVKGIPKDRLIKVISHFNIGRKSTDKKENMVYNILNHFKNLLHPTLCQGGCGATLEEQFKTCLGCKNEQPRAISKMISFTENLEDIVENLTEITQETFDVYNREQLYRIYEKLIGKKIKNKTKKETVVVLINEELKKKAEEKQKIIDEMELQNKLGGEITLNGITVLAREDGFINATAMCKAGGKQFKHWNCLESTKELIKVLEKVKMGIPTDLDMTNDRLVGEPTNLNRKQFIVTIVTGPNNKRGSWIHPDLAVQLGQWISPEFAIQVSSWVRELALTGSVVVGNEKTHYQLLALQNEIVKQKETINHLENKHNRFLEKQRYHHFKEGPVFYIISDNDSKTIKFKPGIEGSDINRRLAEHRSTTPAIKLEYLVYTKDNALLEKNILKRYKVKRTYQNHEWVFEISKEHIINSVNTLLNFLNIEYTEEKNLDKYNNRVEV